LITIGLATTWIVAGHAASGPHEAVALVIGVLHVLAASVWIGGLAAVPALLRSARSRRPGRAAPRHTRPLGVLDPARAAHRPAPGPLHPYRPGRYRADWPPLPVTGSWRLTITLAPGATAQTQLPLH
jgi:hypothetical protein